MLLIESGTLCIKSRENIEIKATDILTKGSLISFAIEKSIIEKKQ